MRLVLGVGLTAFLLAFLSCTFWDCRGNLAKLRINSFGACVEAGFPVVASTPRRCVVSNETIFTDEGPDIKINNPQAGDLVASPLLIQGSARASGNIVRAELVNPSGEIIASGSTTTDSSGHATFGNFELKLGYQAFSNMSATLVVFDGNAPGDANDTTIRLPLDLQNTAPRVERPRDAPAEFNPLTNAPTDLPPEILLAVPFTSQAPLQDWSAPYNEACEEAALLMVEYFLRDSSLSVATANREILDLVDWETRNGYAVDATIKEVSAFARSYFGRPTAIYSGSEVTIENIKRLLAAGLPVIIPAAGQLLGNPHFTGAGPPYHMLVVTGYKNGVFVTNDPGTKFGENYKYNTTTLDQAIHDWYGSKDNVLEGPRAILVVGK